MEIIPSHNDATLTQHNAEVVVILRKSYNLFQDVHLQKKKSKLQWALSFSLKAAAIVRSPSSGV